MESKVSPNFDDMVRDIPDGSTIFIGGFGTVGMPYNLIKALYNQGSKGHTLIGNNMAADMHPHIEITVANLVADGRVRKIVSTFTAPTHPSMRTRFDDLYESGEVEAELVAQGTLAERIRCAGAGIPAFYTPAGVGTELAEGKEHREFNGRMYIMEEALPADYAFIRAWRSDEFGNLVFKLVQRNFNPLMATAARHTFVEAEEVVPIGSIDPDDVHTPGIYVQNIAPIPPDGVFHAIGLSHLKDQTRAAEKAVR